MLFQIFQILKTGVFLIPLPIVQTVARALPL
jgi:hypothetical protein